MTKSITPHIYQDDRFSQQYAVLALLLERQGGRVKMRRLIDMYLLLQHRVMMQCGHLIGDREWVRFNPKQIELLSLKDPERAKKSLILRDCLQVVGSVCTLTPLGYEGLNREDWEDPRNLYGQLSEMLVDEVDALVRDYQGVSDLSLRKAVQQRFPVASGTWLSWDQIIGQCQHWDDECPSVRAYLVDEVLSLRRCFDGLLDLTDDRELVKAGFEAGCIV